MKRITLSLLSLALIGLSVNAQELQTGDRSARAVRPVSDNNGTATDQSNDTRDIEITAAIRRALMSDDSISQIAKNVTVTTNDGIVTLRGQVKSDAERSEITEIAEKEADGMQIDNRLEVNQSGR